jgi:uncharacterized protein
MRIYLFLGLLCSSLFLRANENPPSTPAAVAAQAPRQFLIVLHVVPRLHDEKAWTAADNATIAAHFERLKAATASGQVLLAGRTTEALDRTMGLIIFSAADENAARNFLAADPCVAAGVMTAELHPYAVALRGK